MQKQRIHHLLLLLALVFGSGAAAHPLAEPQANGMLVTHSLHHLQRESFEQVGLVEVVEDSDWKGVIKINDQVLTSTTRGHDFKLVIDVDRSIYDLYIDKDTLNQIQIKHFINGVDFLGLNFQDLNSIIQVP